MTPHMGKLAEKSRFTVGDWTVEPDSDRITHGETTVELEPRVMDLLVHLAEHAGETVSINDLAATVWAGHVVSDNPVYQAIAQLRKALGDEAQHPRYIATVTKRGYRLVAPVEHTDVPPGEQRPKWGRVPLAIGLVLAAVAAWVWFDNARLRDAPEPSSKPFNSIAVLPFRDMSEDGSQEYLGDGIAEELIHRFAAMPDVKVIARTSSFAFRGEETDVRKIGADLGVEAVLEGSVRRSGNRLRITAQLVSTVDGFHIWSQSYEPTASDAIAIQDQIADGVSRFLGDATSRPSAMEHRWTLNAEAAETYYLGTYHMHKRRPEPLNQALEYLRLAIEHDPGFAQAHAALAKASFLASDARYGDLPDEVAMLGFREALRTAATLDAGLPEVLEMQTVDEDDPATLERLILQAISANPNHAPAFKVYSFVLRMTGRWDEALLAAQKSVALDPLNPALRMNLAQSLMEANRPAEAEAELLTASDLDPGWHGPYWALARVATVTGQLARSIEFGTKAASIEGPQARWAGEAALVVAYAYLTLGDFESAEQWIKQSRESEAGGFFLANYHLHLLLAQDRYGEADALLTHWEAKRPASAVVFNLGGLYRAIMGQDAAAIDMYETAIGLQDDDAMTGSSHLSYMQWGYIPTVHLARLRLLAGDTRRAELLLDQSRELLGRVQQSGSGAPGPGYAQASLLALQGDNQAALAALRTAVDSGWSILWFLERDPVFTAYHGNLEFESIREQLRTHLAAERQKLDKLALN